ncbi:hypothetical protein DFH08DRAFT_820893 [Mycena albidolilacea]|uniref:Uncharacterized protein n=1 Tax=Mycena albidolilacea TaxID=1033008 RepID=A0AAD6ZB00_9AGAR|nr:hypothetical protein DFH08DRAFT_820893 [Mycena albidolilacea]
MGSFPRGLGREERCLQFNFHWYFEEEDTSQIPENLTQYLLLQHAIFCTLVANLPPSSLISLTLHNTPFIPDDIYLNVAFHRILAPLHSLVISTLSNMEDKGTCSFRILHLVSLMLYNLVIEPAVVDTDMMVFILHHMGTLTRLALHRCPINSGEDGVFLHLWHAVLVLFQAELDGLHNFVFVNNNPRNRVFECDAWFVYMWLDHGWGYMLWEEELVTEGLELPALESLQVVIVQYLPRIHTNKQQMISKQGHGHE